VPQLFAVLLGAADHANLAAHVAQRAALLLLG